MLKHFHFTITYALDWHETCNTRHHDIYSDDVHAQKLQEQTSLNYKTIHFDQHAQASRCNHHSIQSAYPDLSDAIIGFNCNTDSPPYRITSWMKACCVNLIPTNNILLDAAKMIFHALRIVLVMMRISSKILKDRLHEPWGVVYGYMIEEKCRRGFRLSASNLGSEGLFSCITEYEYVGRFIGRRCDAYYHIIEKMELMSAALVVNLVNAGVDVAVVGVRCWCCFGSCHHLVYVPRSAIRQEPQLVRCDD